MIESMCLAIPKKVVAIISDSEAIVESMDGSRQKAGSVISLNIGDFVLLKRGVAVERVDRETAEETVNLLKGGSA